MNISYKWLKSYIDTALSPEETAAALTDIGLETGGIEEVESIRGGLRGLVAGKVLTCAAHPDSDHLHITTVDIGAGGILPIVCGAPNVAAGQTVAVAPVGTVLYDGDTEFKIKKSKIRGEVSEGMICSEKEIGLSQNHDGIMTLPDTVAAGTPIADYFQLDSDYRLEVDLTPNRIDAASHIGVARDLAAYLSKDAPVTVKKPSVADFRVDDNSRPIPVEVANPEACIRYSALTISGVTIKESPEWLQKRLKAIGLHPINNVVDITNFILYEYGQPLHAFDADKITGGKVIVRTLPAGSKIVTLDEVERTLADDDLIICNTCEGMCIAGVFGGRHSGISGATVNVFLESACFDPVFVRRTARRHGLSTDASFRYERGSDPNITVEALKRAAMLIKETAGGKISSDIVDVYPTPVQDFPVELSYVAVDRLIGKKLGANRIKSILKALEIKIINESADGLSLAVPPYRVDVKREADVIEEILRIYGYNNVEIPAKINASLQYRQRPDAVKIRNTMADYLVAQGFSEIWSNSLTKLSYYEQCESYPASGMVRLLNPLSADLGGLRQTLLFGGLEAIAYNANRQNPNLRLFESGNCYSYAAPADNNISLRNYCENEHFALFVTGKKENESWTMPQSDSSFFQLKAYVENLLLKMGFNLLSIKLEYFTSDLFAEGVLYLLPNGKALVEAGVVRRSILKRFGLENQVFYADIAMGLLQSSVRNHSVSFRETPKYPEVRRDLALLLDNGVAFAQIRDLAFKLERKILRAVDLFDVYDGKGVPEGKKSYAVSFILRDDERTLEDKYIDRVMQRFVDAFAKELGAILR
ncbi:MAG: phenylalanine--tRNA ligase subunit beta [Bacteroidales bacterium]|jgi:phenylalanyl-tRNA synthetase beta chain|nr:phenylalanine--tRNA ligase subunit beta [Bacteroidales bacterium]